MLGQFETFWQKKKMGIIPKDGKPSRAKYSQEKYQFMLNCPYNVSHMCCNIMKKQPMHKYAKETGRKAITGQMADESMLRLQQWIKHGCNGFDLKIPVSNPMSFWTQQDVLEYIKTYKLPICSVYGDIVEDISGTEEVENQMTFSDLECNCGDDSFDAEKLPLKTTGCNRTGCCYCAYGLHLEKSPNRLQLMSKTHPQLFDYVMRGGGFNEDGIFLPTNDGLGYWFVLQYINVHSGGKVKIDVPRFEEYEAKYGTEKTRAYLRRE